MNLFYAPPGQIEGKLIELRDQEARHAAKVLRYREGDSIAVTDGEGVWYEGTVRKILERSVRVEIREQNRKKRSGPRLVLGMGIIKKRDRLEFAVEKAVELGAREIALFRSEHTVKENVRIDRLEAAALSAMKQSLRVYLPAVKILTDLESALKAYPKHMPLIAHEKSNGNGEPGIPESCSKAERLLLLVGPEGGFTEEEVAMVRSVKHAGQVVSLGEYRLRTETAVIALMSQFL